MADTSNLSQFLTDVASAIKEKTGKTDKIPAANFDSEILSIKIGGDVKLFETQEEMQADTTAKEGDLATVYGNEIQAVQNGDTITSITFPKTVVFTEAIASVYYGILRNSSAPRIYLDIQLSSTNCSFMDMDYTIPSITYSSTDGITYTRTDSNDDTYEIGETTISNLPEPICKFITIGKSIFEGLFKYEETVWVTAPTQLTATADYVYNEMFLGKNGVETGTLTTSVSNSFADTNAAIYKKIQQAYNNMTPRVLTDTDKTIDTNIYLIPTRLDGTVLLDTSNVTNMTSMFIRRKNLTEIPELDTSNATDMTNMFRDCENLITIPLLDTSNVTNMEYMFEGCTNLTEIPELDTSNANHMNGMFEGCTNLTEIPLLNTSNVTNMEYMFYGCTNLTEIPELDTSNVRTMYRMFRDCENLTTIPLLDTSNVTTMDDMFYGCTNLTEIPELDTSNANHMEYMFWGCTNLTEIPLLNTSKVRTMYHMFRDCENLITIPLLDTSDAMRMAGMFYGCTNLTEIPELDTSNANHMTDMFRDCPSLSDESLNNILIMCINAVNVTNNKTLNAIGLTEEQATKCMTLSNYQAFLDAGWTTGY